MNAEPALAGLRIGCVKYLNARPLIHSYDGPVLFAHPSELARGLAAGQLDAALVPVFEMFRAPGYQVVDDVAIASDGEVYSVFLAYRGALENVRRIALDPASLTSIHLVQVLLAEFYGITPECIDARKSVGEVDGELLIGNQAIAFRQSAGSDIQILDLGAAWKEKIGLPFVYAVWLLRPGLKDTSAIGEAFRRLKVGGLERLEEIVATEKTCSSDFARTYLTEHIRFDLRDREKAGMRKYGELLWKRGFVGAPPAELEFV